MECDNCDYATENKKSFSNHLRFGCHGYEKDKKCVHCQRVLTGRKPNTQGKFCNRQCYGLWRSENCLGKDAPSYKDGRCKERQLVRARLPFKNWRKAVFQRDGYTCQECNDKRGGNLEAHHIRSVALFPEAIYDVNNGLTLCKKCHKETENYGFTKENTKTD